MTPSLAPERVIRAPTNSSWADVLRIEAAEKQLAGAARPPRAPLSRRRGATAAGAAAALPGRRSRGRPRGPRQGARRAAVTVYHHLQAPEMDDEMMDGAGEGGGAIDEYEAQRFIFCSRAYMFDGGAVRAPGSRRRTATHTGAASPAVPACPPRCPRASATRPPTARAARRPPAATRNSPTAATRPRRRRRPRGRWCLPLAVGRASGVVGGGADYPSAEGHADAAGSARAPLGLYAGPVPGAQRVARHRDGARVVRACVRACVFTVV